MMINSKAGRGRGKIEELIPPGLDLELERPPSLEAAQDLFQEWRLKHRRIVLVGGDGTFHLAAEQLVDGESPALELGLVPAGTGSDFNRALPGPGDLRSRIELALQGEKTQPLRLGVVESEGQRTGFINVASVGLSGYVADNVERIFKKVGVAGYSLAMFHGIATFKPQTMVINVDGEQVHGGATMICAVGCGRYFGGGKMVTPHGEPFGDDLHVVAICMTKLKALWATRLLPTGDHLALDGVIQCRGKKVELIGGDEVKGEYDGEPGPSLPITITRGPVHGLLVVSDEP